MEQIATSLERRQEGRLSEKELCSRDNGRGRRVKRVVSRAGLHEGDHEGDDDGGAGVHSHVQEALLASAEGGVGGNSSTSEGAGNGRTNKVGSEGEILNVTLVVGIEPLESSPNIIIV